MGKAPSNEAGLVVQIVKAVKTAFPAAWVMKVHGGPMQVAGIPDLLIVIDGKLIGAEVKHQKLGESVEHARGRATAIQRNQIKKLREAGAVADVVLSSEETLDLIGQALGQKEKKEFIHVP